jgi:hypothetical protein
MIFESVMVAVISFACLMLIIELALASEEARIERRDCFAHEPYESCE